MESQTRSFILELEITKSRTRGHSDIMDVGPMWDLDRKTGPVNTLWLLNIIVSLLDKHASVPHFPPRFVAVDVVFAQRNWPWTYHRFSLYCTTAVLGIGGFWGFGIWWGKKMTIFSFWFSSFYLRKKNKQNKTKTKIFFLQKRTEVLLSHSFFIKSIFSTLKCRVW